MDNFQKAFTYALKNEGEFSNTRGDRGGPTKYGITVGTLTAWRGDTCYAGDVAKLELDEAKEIYKSWYWNNMGLDNVPDPICVALFDTAILFGVTSTVREAQSLLVESGFKIKVDGIMGMITQDCLRNVDSKFFVLGFHDRLGKLVEAITRKNPTQKMFKAGWVNRLDRLETLVA